MRNFFLIIKFNNNLIYLIYNTFLDLFDLFGCRSLRLSVNDNGDDDYNDGVCDDLTVLIVKKHLLFYFFF
jgi:hypothetical protein